MPDPTVSIAVQIETEKQSVGEHESISRHRLSVAEQDRLLRVRGAHVVIAEPWSTDRKSQLIQREVLLHSHCE